MAKIIKAEDFELFMELEKENRRLADILGKVKENPYEASHEKAFLRIALCIGKESLNLIHEVDDAKLEQLIDEGAKRDGGTNQAIPARA